MIITKIIGGLGNQMFQYAAGRSLALASGCRLKLDISGFDNYAIHNGYELGLFNIKAEIASVEEVLRFVGSSPRIARFLRKTTGVGKKSYYLDDSCSSYALDKDDPGRMCKVSRQIERILGLP